MQRKVSLVLPKKLFAGVDRLVPGKYSNWAEALREGLRLLVEIHEGPIDLWPKIFLKAYASRIRFSTYSPSRSWGTRAGFVNRELAGQDARNHIEQELRRRGVKEVSART